MVDPKRHAELSEEAAKYVMPAELRAKLRDALTRLAASIEIPVDKLNDSDAWWEKAAQYLSPQEYHEFLELYGDKPGYIEPLVYLRERIKHEETQSAEQIRQHLTPLEECGLAWINRDGLDHNMDEFLARWFSETNIYIKREKFKKTLSKMGTKGLIVKINRRWKAKSNT